MSFKKILNDLRLQSSRIKSVIHKSLQSETMNADDIEATVFEDRVMYSASPLVALPQEMIAQETDGFGETQPVQDELSSSPRHIVFVDSSVEDYESLIEDSVIASDDATEVVILSNDRDGIEQISDFLTSNSGIESIHVVSHGSDGRVNLGNSQLNAQTVNAYASQFVQWRSALTDGADILFYGCNLAETEEGEFLIQAISELTLADVAASDDLTGHAELGGDWDLEFSVGEIESNFVFSNAFSSSWFSTLDIKSELIAHYQFEENGGSTVYDVTANYNDGSWFHAPAWSADSVVGNYSLDFSGDTVNNNAVVTVPDDPTLDFSEDFSIAFWYNATIAQADGTQIIGSHDGNDGFSIYADANGDLNFLLEGSSSSTTRKETNGFISDGNWHHIVATRSGNTIRIYIDNNANGINSVPIGDVDVSAPLLIGGEGTTGANFEGKLDDIRIYGRALSSTDISELYNANGGVAITVDTTTDNVDGNTTNLIDLISNRGADGYISLREAVLAAENTVGPTTIHLGSGVHTLTSGGNLTINSDVTISGVAQGSVIDASSLGDRIFHVIGGSQLSLEDLVLTGGSANGAGGGAVLVASGSSLIADDVVFTGNDATGWGGAIQNFGDVVLNDVAIVNNSATRGGGIRTSVGTLTMTNTTISGNFSAEQGGGIDTDSGTVNANHVSIIDNTSLTSEAGGVHAHGTVAFNTQNSIFADNTASVGGNDIDGTINSLGFNFVEDTDNVTGLEATDITGADPMLNPLQEINGTFVHTLQAGSLAIDAGTFTANLFDQIGEFRVGNADIGAVEYVIADLTTGLFIHHEYEENSGLTANDSSGNNNSGTLINGAAWTGNHAIGNHALDFTIDSTANSYVSVPYDPSLDIASNFAISFWYNADAHAGSTADIIRQFSIGDGFFISHNASGDLLFLIQGSGGTGFVAADNGFVPDSNWHHVVAQKNGTDLEIYIDGSLSASNSNFTGTVSSFEPFLIGGSDTSDYDGLLDDVRGYSRALGGADIAALYAMESGSASTAQTFTVTNTADSGAGSLRQAIVDANANLGADTIDFNIAGSGTQVIQLSSALPTLTEQVTIDGTTQTGWIADTFLPIVIDGNGLNNTGLILNQNADGSTIKGLVVRDFSSIGISAQNNSDNHTIQGNFIGAFQSDGSFDNTSVQSPSSGIYLDGNSSVVGGIGIGESNRFVGSAAGIWISTGDNHQIIGNQMGYVASPNVPVGNPIYGILVQGSDNLISDNTIVGSSVHGINVELGTGNELRRNSISQSDGLGINLGTDGRSANDAGDTDSGANNLQNWAVLTSVSIADDGTFEYVLDTTSLGLGTYSVDFFASSDRDGGQVEGQRFLGTVSGIANGLSSLTGTLSGITLAPGEHVTAVTTDSLGNSSEFSNYAVAVDSDAGGTTPLDLQAVSTNESGLQLNQGGGNNAYLETSEAVFNDNGQITIEVEFSIDSPAVGLTTLFSYADSDSQDELFLAVDSSGEVFFRTSENGGLGYGSTAVSAKLFDGDLHTVSVTWDSASGVIMFYVDGQQLGLGRNSYQTGTTISSTGTVV
ncbi:MAG: LamG-like jellyroll fold domain-containing protein, partial [Planctomycetota bacterium]